MALAPGGASPPKSKKKTLCEILHFYYGTNKRTVAQNPTEELNFEDDEDSLPKPGIPSQH